jgi:hypothetical protein
MRITLPNVWPFMKLPNGFGSHRYLYSPILFDSQELILFYLSTRTSCHADDASPVTTIVPRVVDRQWNGDADGYQLSFLAAAGAAPEDDYGDRAFADGQWKCVRPARHPGSCCMRQSWYYASGRAGFCNGEWRM